MNEPLEIKIVYDNTSLNPAMKEDWGFSCHIRYGDTAILFDTGANEGILMDNLHACHVNPSSIQAIFLSHNHFDHAGGIFALLKGLSVPCFLPKASEYRLGSKIASSGGTPVFVSEKTQVAPHFWSTGQMKGSIKEHALVIEKENELVLITGCAHPGIVNIVGKVIQDFGKAPTWVLGGFHFYKTSQKEVLQCTRHLKELGVAHIAPCHCTGKESVELIKEAWGEGFEAPSVGWTRRL